MAGHRAPRVHREPGGELVRRGPVGRGGPVAEEAVFPVTGEGSHPEVVRRLTTAAALVASLAKARLTGRLEEQLLNYPKPKLAIVDELGYPPLEVDAAHLFFQLVNRRHEHGGFLVTSNRPVGEWGRVFGDDVVATAILDRLLPHGHIVNIRGNSYRMRDRGDLDQVLPQVPARKNPGQGLVTPAEVPR